MRDVVMREVGWVVVASKVRDGLKTPALSQNLTREQRDSHVTPAPNETARLQGCVSKPRSRMRRVLRLAPMWGTFSLHVRHTCIPR